MDTAKRQALEAAGWKFGNAEDFLGERCERGQPEDSAPPATRGGLSPVLQPSMRSTASGDTRTGIAGEHTSE